MELRATICRIICGTSQAQETLARFCPAGLTEMTPSEYTPLSPRILYPRIRGSGLGAAVEVQSQIGRNDGVIVAGEVEESKEIEADSIDIEDVQPKQIMPTPDLPSRAVIEEHRIDHWPPRSLCDECNEGHGRERRHGKVQLSTELP